MTPVLPVTPALPTISAFPVTPAFPVSLHFLRLDHVVLHTAQSPLLLLHVIPFLNKEPVAAMGPTL